MILTVGSFGAAVAAEEVLTFCTVLIRVRACF